MATQRLKLTSLPFSKHTLFGVNDVHEMISMLQVCSHFPLTWLLAVLCRSVGLWFAGCAAANSNHQALTCQRYVCITGMQVCHNSMFPWGNFSKHANLEPTSPHRCSRQSVGCDWPRRLLVACAGPKRFIFTAEGKGHGAGRPS